METVVIITPRDYDQEFSARMSRFQLARTDEGWLVRDGRSSAWLARNPQIRDGLMDDELAYVLAQIPEPVFYGVDFSGDIRHCHRVLLALIDDPELLVDNDNGLVLRGPEFAHRLRSHPDWDWRLD